MFNFIHVYIIIPVSMGPSALLWPGAYSIVTAPNTKTSNSVILDFLSVS